MTRSIKFSFSVLSDEAIEILRGGWCINESPHHLWLSKAQWLDSTHDDLCHERNVEEISYEELEIMFNSFIDSLSLSDDIYKSIIELWKDNEDNEVEWK